MPEQAQLIHDEMSAKIVQAAAGLALREGASGVTVRKIIRTLGMTNRVFYNRFRNVDEVLRIVYRDMAVKMRQGILSRFDLDGDYFGQVTDIASETLVLSYRLKSGMNHYVFTQDSVSSENFAWWQKRIRELIVLGKSKGLVRHDLDDEVMSYAIWCFIRGYNADALARGLPEKQALEGFRYAFGVFLDGLHAR